MRAPIRAPGRDVTCQAVPTVVISARGASSVAAAYTTGAPDRRDGQRASTRVVVIAKTLTARPENRRRLNAQPRYLTISVTTATRTSAD
jgi:hypothetical protein